jgi:hypothetical protein
MRRSSLDFERSRRNVGGFRDDGWKHLSRAGDGETVWPQADLHSLRVLRAKPTDYPL